MLTLASRKYEALFQRRTHNGRNLKQDGQNLHVYFDRIVKFCPTILNWIFSAYSSKKKLEYFSFLSIMPICKIVSNFWIATMRLQSNL